MPDKWKLFAGFTALLLCGCGARERRFIGYRLTGTPPAAVTCVDQGAAAWCVHEPRGAASRDVVYFLHYATGDERSWDSLGLARAFYGEYRRLKKPAPRVVTISWGTHWVLTSRPGLRQTVDFREFDALRRRIEAGLGGVGKRYLWGMSMGGYNAAAEALREPALWSAVAVHCPAIPSGSPYASTLPDQAFLRGIEGKQLFTHRLAGEESWREDEPFSKAAGPHPPFWIESNDDDEFGYFAGAQALAKALGARFVKTKGGHCVIDARAAARFLAEN